MKQDSQDGEIPAPPNGLIDACKKGELIIFVGAGVSQLKGSPGWKEFADILLDDLHKASLISFSEVQQFKDLDAKKKISLARIVANNSRHIFDFKKLLQDDKKIKDTSIISDLVSIGVPIVTTNYDEWLGNELEKSIRKREVANKDAVLQESSDRKPEEKILTSKSPTVFWRKDDMIESKLRLRDVILHLHGHLSEHESLILSTSDYFNHYAEEYIQVFLERLFSRYTVLFIGYSLEDAEILEIIFRATRLQNAQIGSYWLYPCCRNQSEFITHIKGYYKDLCNVEIVPYYIDTVGYRKLESLMSVWAPVLSKHRQDPEFLKNLQLIDEALHDG